MKKMMTHAWPFNMVIAMLLLSACNANNSAPGGASSAAPTISQSASEPSVDRTVSPSATSSSVQKSVDTPSRSTTSIDGVAKGMAYADFRKALLAQGWEPVVDHKCKANVVGDAYEELCAKGSDACKACDELPELSACSGDAECVMNFRHADETLQASAYGDIADRNIHGKDSQLNITGWKVSAAPAK